MTLKGAKFIKFLIKPENLIRCKKTDLRLLNTFLLLFALTADSSLIKRHYLINYFQ